MLRRFGQKPVVYVLAGPNGSGKTTYFERVLSRWTGEFVNPDRMAAQMNPADPGAVAWEAARMADARRTELLRGGDDFVTETVFSHPSKLDFLSEARLAGYHVRMLFFCLEDPTVNALRVALRVTRGGHDVPRDRIEARYTRSLALAFESRKLANELWLFDNSVSDQLPRRVAMFADGELVSLRPPIPNWLRRTFGAEIDAFLKRGA